MYSNSLIQSEATKTYIVFRWIHVAQSLSCSVVLCLSFIVWPLLYCLSFVDLRLPIHTTVDQEVYSYHLDLLFVLSTLYIGSCIIQFFINWQITNFSNPQSCIPTVLIFVSSLLAWTIVDNTNHTKILIQSEATKTYIVFRWIHVAQSLSCSVVLCLSFIVWPLLYCIL
jgi:hypothetical protein